MDQLRYSLAVFNRLVGVFAVAPATALLVIFGFAYQFSFQAAARDAYSYIDEIARSQKDAQPGFLTIRRCAQSRAHEEGSEALPLAICEKYDMKQVSVDALAVEAAATLSTYYWMLVLLGFGINIAAMGPRRFFMMEGAATATEDATPAKRL